MSDPRRNRSSFPLAAGLFALLGALPLAAQGTIQDGNAVYRLGTIAANQADAVDADFTADPAVSDVLEEQWWYYRIDNDPDERPLRDDGAFSQSYSGTHADLRWANVEQRGLISVHLGLDVVSTGPNSGAVYHGITVFNISGRSLILNLFHYADLDVCGTTGSTVVGTQWDHKISGGCTGQSVSVNVYDSSNYFFENRDDSECDILDPGPLTLPDVGLPFAGGNVTGALQWTDVSLPPGTQYTCWVRLEHQPGPCGLARSRNYGYGRAGTVGIPQIRTVVLPRLGTNGVIEVSNARTNSIGLVFFGFGRIDIPIGPLNLQVLAGPRGSDFDSFGISTDAAGIGRFALPIPPRREFCATRMTFQAFVYDPGTPIIPLSQTDGLEWILGR